MKYKVGEIVTIRHDLSEQHTYIAENDEELYCAHEMEAYRGVKCEIYSIDYQYYEYYLKIVDGPVITPWVWCAEMFEDIDFCIDADELALLLEV